MKRVENNSLQHSASWRLRGLQKHAERIREDKLDVGVERVRYRLSTHE